MKLLGIIVLLVALAGCGSSAVSRTGHDDSSCDSCVTVSGSVVDTQGQPLTTASIQFDGTASNGNWVRFTLPVDGGGQYSTIVPTGNYQISAYNTVTFDGRQFWLALEPSNGTAATQTLTSDTVQNFQWVLTGLMPGADPNDHTQYFGGSINVNPNGADFMADPPDTQLQFNLTPDGPLIDGSSAQTLTFTRTVGDWGFGNTGGLIDNSPYLYDIPLGNYTLTGQLMTLDGQSRPLQFQGPGGTPATSVDVQFSPVEQGVGISDYTVLVS